MGTLGLAAVLVVALYLAAFLAASRLAEGAAGRPVWLFGRATGRDRLAALGFRAAFALALLGPLLMAAWPALAAIDPLWGLGGPASATAGLLVALAGAMLAWGAQVAMGASWRVGVADDAVGDLVTDGPFGVSRNPVFAGQLLLLAGVALAAPSLATLAAALILWLSARTQIASEERVLGARHGVAFEAYKARVPRWLGMAQGGSGARPARATPPGVDRRQAGP